MTCDDVSMVSVRADCKNGTGSAVRFDRVILGSLHRVANDRSRPTWNDTSFFKRFAK